MPATEQTWYDQKKMHIVFGFSGLVMLVATVWMFAADQDREWKNYQRTFRRAEQQLTSWQIDDQQSRDMVREQMAIESQLTEARLTAPPNSVYGAFKSELQLDAQQRSRREYDFSSVDQEYEQFATVGEKAMAALAVAKELGPENVRASDAVAEARQALEEAAADKTAKKLAKKSLNEAEQSLDAVNDQQRDAEKSAKKLVDQALDLRQDYFTSLTKYLDKARGREDALSSNRKFKSADLDAAKARLDLMVRDNRSDDDQAAQQKTIDALKVDLDQLSLDRQAATAHRVNLQHILAAMKSDELRLQTQLDASAAEYQRLVSVREERRVSYFTRQPPFIGKRWLELPILDAFNSPLKIDNLWTDGLKLKYGSFSEVRRFDRCTTCHKGIDKTAPGSSVDPLYVENEQLIVQLQTPEEAPQPSDPQFGLTLEDVYGFRVADRGLIDRNDVTVSHVNDRSLAATSQVTATNPDFEPQAGLQVGDVIEYVNDDKVLSAAEARQFMITGATFGTPLTLTVQRGLPQPFASHPRLDLFVGSMSPHKLSQFGCTSCHEGQGSGTSFSNASHTPNSPAEARQWALDRGWAPNPHWILPMYPQRFAESACLRCHHHVMELEPSERFPEPPAPKLMAGYHLVADYGCFGCHEINGYAGPEKRIGPDLRLEPNYFAAAATVAADPAFEKLDDEVQSWARTLTVQPERDEIRHQLSAFLKNDAKSENPILHQRSHAMVDVLQNVETPGQMRRVGPSLRYVKHKLSDQFLLDWIRTPSHFRPTTKMPQFFGLWDHLEDADRDLTKNYEQVELHAVAAYLLDRSEPFTYATPEPGVEQPSADRGKLAFEVRGCLACHQHQDFPDIKSTHGPELTNIGDKLSKEVGAPNGQAWLYSWLKNPNNYHARTKMPNLILDPEQTADGKSIDPAADITAYLLNSSNGWKPDPAALVGFDPNAMDGVILEYLAAAFPRRDAEQYLQTGIPEAIKATLKGDEVELVGGASEHQKLMYVGRKTISKYGCYGCHDIPGFEAAKPIGTALADWGTKESSKLAFEHIEEYLHHGHGTAPTQHGEPQHVHETDTSEQGTHETATVHEPPSPESDEAFFLQQLAMQDRSGFIWQKLREPRSYDYRKTTNKKYSERLRMPLFGFDAEQREQVITFVLGLVATPPAEQFVYSASPQRKAITEGLAVVQEFNCTGCHLLDAETWQLEFQPGEIDEPPATTDFPFLAHNLAPDELDESAKPDSRRGVLKATVHGMTALENSSGQFMTWDEDWEPVDPDELSDYATSELVYPIQLWQPAVIGGNAYDAGRITGVPANAVKHRMSAFGGDLALYLLPRLTALEKEANPNANGTESWGWGPPPLIGEGKKVNAEWLHSFLLDPYPIRPEVFLRMPKFNMSSSDATKLVNYFAAKENVDYPFEYDPRKNDGYLTQAEQAFQGDEGRLDHAMKIVTNANYCVKCHLVGDFKPEGSVRALAPNLAMAQQRLRPEYMKRWIANPLKILPYTPMPVNVNYDPTAPHLGGVDQSIYPGTSVDQLNALVDLLSNFGEYMTQKTSVTDLVSEASKNAPVTDSEEPASQKSARLPRKNSSPQAASL